VGVRVHLLRHVDGMGVSSSIEAIKAIILIRFSDHRQNPSGCYSSHEIISI
jgi:hypothetical protein